MTVPDAVYTQRGTYHEFYDEGERGVPASWLEIGLASTEVSLYTFGTLHLNLSDARILRDILTEHIARQERKPA